VEERGKRMEVGWCTLLCGGGGCGDGTGEEARVVWW